MPLPFLFLACGSRAMSFRRRLVPSVFFFSTLPSSQDQDRRRTNPIAHATITELRERESTKLIEVEIERKEEKAMVCGDAVHMITCVAGKEALRRFRHDGFFFFGRMFHRQRVCSCFSIGERSKRWIRSTEWYGFVQLSRDCLLN